VASGGRWWPQGVMDGLGCHGWPRGALGGHKGPRVAMGGLILTTSVVFIGKVVCGHSPDRDKLSSVLPKLHLIESLRGLESGRP
jgi:hypothetical protein